MATQHFHSSLRLEQNSTYLCNGSKREKGCLFLGLAKKKAFNLIHHLKSAERGKPNCLKLQLFLKKLFLSGKYFYSVKTNFSKFGDL